jgi:hypothetical protein
MNERVYYVWEAPCSGYFYRCTKPTVAGFYSENGSYFAPVPYIIRMKLKERTI